MSHPEPTTEQIVNAQLAEIERLRSALRRIACRRILDAEGARMMSQVAKEALAHVIPGVARRRARVRKGMHME